MPVLKRISWFSSLKKDERIALVVYYITMSQRLDYFKTAPKALKGLLDSENYLRNASIEPSLFELVKLRASQINGCAYCIDMHTKDARANGETEQRLYTLSAWRETSFYTEREKIALELTEVLTEIANNEVSDELYNRANREFSEKELVDLTMAIVAINSWNRIALTFKTEAGSYQPTK